MNKNDKYFRLGRFQWVLYALIAVLLIASIMRSQWGAPRAWEQCKESLFSQMLSGECTPRRSNTPSGEPIILKSPGTNA